MINDQRQPWKKENNKGIFKMNKRRIIFILLLLNIFVNAQTEKKIIKQGFLWTRYNNQLELNPKWTFLNEIDNRVFLKDFNHTNLVVRSHIRNKVNENIEIGAGLVYSGSKKQNSDETSSFIVPEYRVQQDLTLKQQFRKIGLAHRFVIEERFFRNANSDGLEERFNFRWRFRYRMQGDFYLWKKENQGLKAILSDEIMINAGNKIVNNVFDQNRMYVALLFEPNKSLGIELGYLNAFQQQTSGIDFNSNNIIRFTFYHKLKL